MKCKVGTQDAMSISYDKNYYTTNRSVTITIKGKWTKFKSWTRLSAFPLMLMPWGKKWIHLFFSKLKINSKVGLGSLALKWPSCLKRKLFIQTSCTLLKNKHYVKSYPWWKGWMNTYISQISSIISSGFNKHIE